MRIVVLVVTAYLAVMWAYDSLTFDGHYRKVVWAETNHQVQRVNNEVRGLLKRIGI
jgi:hypothetical protein